MDIKKIGKDFANKIQSNLKPNLGSLLPTRVSRTQSEIKSDHDIPSKIKQLGIQETYRTLKQNCVVDAKANIKLITCLKAAQKSWQEYLAAPNKNGQAAWTYELRLKKINEKYQSELSRMIVQGSLDNVKQASDILRPLIEHLEKKSRKYREHESEFKVISRNLETQSKEYYEQEEEIKEEMIDLVQKFKKYAINIQQNLRNDSGVIEQINQSQDKQLDSLTSKNTSMQQIIKEQKLGFFQLVGMAIFAVVLWIVGLMIIIIV